MSNTVEKLQNRRDVLASQLLDSSAETERINRLENETNTLIQQRNAKVEFNRPIETEIGHIDQIIKYLSRIDENIN